MTKNYKRRAIDQIHFSIGTKLIIIISFIVVISLGSITAFASLLIREDLRVTSEDTNFDINRRSALETEAFLSNMRSGSKVLLQMVSPAGMRSSAVKEAADFFFEENPAIAAVFSIVPGRTEQLLVNSKFFSSRGLKEELAGSWFNSQRAALGRAARGETLLYNAMPHFSRSVLALYYPGQNGGVNGVIFSSEELSGNFGTGANQSYMINSEGDILVSSDFDLMLSAVNIADEDFIRDMLDSPDRSKQQLIESEFKFLQGSVYKRSGFSETTWSTIKPYVQPALNKIGGTFDVSFPEINIGKKQQGLSRQFIAYTKINIAGAVVITGIEYDKIFEGIEATTRRNIYLTIAVLSLSIIFIWFFSKTISFPLRLLASQARELEGGNFEIEIDKLKRRDEIGLLTGSFKKMGAALHIFGRFTNRDIAIKAMRNQIKPGGTPKHATIFFSDIRSFTAMSEGFTKAFGEAASDKIVFWLNEYFTEMIRCVEKTNGVVDKFIGDAVMAHWGTAYTDGTPEEDAFNCVMAALMMRKSLYVLNKKRKPGDKSNPSIRIGCGINSGIVTAGQIGSDLRMEYTVIGDPVNLASRVEALTKPLGADILIAEDTWLMVKDQFITEEMPSVTVKGKEAPVRIFAVVNFAGASKGPRTMADVRALLGIDAPELSKVDVDADEKKYKIGTEAKK
jgi:adenylate cyclase